MTSLKGIVVCSLLMGLAIMLGRPALGASDTTPLATVEAFLSAVAKGNRVAAAGFWANKPGFATHQGSWEGWRSVAKSGLNFFKQNEIKKLTFVRTILDPKKMIDFRIYTIYKPGEKAHFEWTAALRGKIPQLIRILEKARAKAIDPSIRQAIGWEISVWQNKKCPFWFLMMKKGNKWAIADAGWSLLGVGWNLSGGTGRRK